MSRRSTSNSAGAADVSLRRLVADHAVGAEITRYLDRMSASERVEEVLGITGRDLKGLYDAMAGAPHVIVDELVPPNEKGTVIYEGRNSLPMFSRFQKRFVRIGEDVVGYNKQSLSFLTGPGYFVVRDPSGETDNEGELLFDYTVEAPVRPNGWPRYKPNDAGLSRQVFGNLNDHVRRAARGVVVGKAYRLGIDQDAYFSLSRAI